MVVSLHEILLYPLNSRECRTFQLFLVSFHGIITYGAHDTNDPYKYILDYEVDKGYFKRTTRVKMVFVNTMWQCARCTHKRHVEV